jgi:hypothetical protein
MSTKTELETENARLRAQLEAAAGPMPESEELMEVVAHSIHQAHLDHAEPGEDAPVRFDDLEETRQQALREAAHQVLSDLALRRWISDPAQEREANQLREQLTARDATIAGLRASMDAAGAHPADGGYDKGHSDAAHKAARMLARATGRQTSLVDEIRAMGADPNAPVL